MASPNSPNSLGSDFPRSDHPPESSNASQDPKPALFRATSDRIPPDPLDLSNLVDESLKTPPGPSPKTPKTPGSVTKKQSLGIIYGDAISSLPSGRNPTKIEVIQLYMHLFDEVRKLTFQIIYRSLLYSK